MGFPAVFFKQSAFNITSTEISTSSIALFSLNKPSPQGQFSVFRGGKWGIGGSGTWQLVQVLNLEAKQPSQLCPLVLCCIYTHSRAVKAISPFQGESSPEQKSPELQPHCQEIEVAPSPNQRYVQVMIRWEWDHPPQDASWLFLSFASPQTACRTRWLSSGTSELFVKRSCFFHQQYSTQNILSLLFFRTSTLMLFLCHPEDFLPAARD